MIVCFNPKAAATYLIRRLLFFFSTYTHALQHLTFLPPDSCPFIKKIQFCSLSLLTEQLFTCYNMNSSSGTCVPDGFATNIVILE